MSNDYSPPLCTNCGKPIIYTGRSWMHRMPDPTCFTPFCFPGPIEPGATVPVATPPSEH